MRVTILFVLCVGVLCIGDIYGAKVSENCLSGKTTATKCCKNIPNGDSTHLANPKDCTSFYICRNNNPVPYACTSGNNWDVDSQKCLPSNTPDICPQKK